MQISTCQTFSKANKKNPALRDFHVLLQPRIGNKIENHIFVIKSKNLNTAYEDASIICEQLMLAFYGICKDRVEMDENVRVLVKEVN